MGIATASKPTIPNRQAKMYAIAFLASSILTSAAPGQLIRVNVIKNSSIVGPVSFGGMRHVGFVPYGYQPVSAGFAHGGAHLVGSHSLVFPVAGSSMSYLPTAAGGTVADSSLSVMGLLNLFDLLDKIASRAPAPRAPISDAKLSDFESRLKSFDEKLSALEKRIDKISEKVELLVKLTEQHDELLKKSPGAGVPKLPTPNP